MKRGLMVGIMGVGLLAGTAQAAVLETFNYTGGTVVSNTATSGSGQQGNWGSFWFSNNTSGTGADMLFASGSLTAPSGYTLTPTNNRLAYDPADSNNNAAAIFEFADTSKLDFSADSMTHYMSFLISAHNNNGASGRIAFQTDTGTTLFTIGELNEANNDPDNGKLGIDVSGSRNFSTGLMDTCGFNTSGTDNLVVLKISTSSAGVDTLSASFWTSGVDTVTGEPIIWDVTHSLSSSLVAAGLRFDVEDGFADLDVSFDEIRIGDSFLAVTGVPEPGTLALMGLGGLMVFARRRAA